jgi:hypothetical protein
MNSLNHHIIHHFQNSVIKKPNNDSMLGFLFKVIPDVFDIFELLHLVKMFSHHHQIYPSYV